MGPSCCSWQSHAMCLKAKILCLASPYHYNPFTTSSSKLLNITDRVMLQNNWFIQHNTSLTSAICFCGEVLVLGVGCSPVAILAVPDSSKLPVNPEMKRLDFGARSKLCTTLRPNKVQAGTICCKVGRLNTAVYRDPLLRPDSTDQSKKCSFLALSMLVLFFILRVCRLARRWNYSQLFSCS